MSAFIPKYLYNFFLKDNSHVIQGNVIFLSHHEEYDYSTGLRCDLQCRLKRATTFYQLVRLVCDVCLCLLVLQLFLKNPLSVYGCYTTVITAINTQKISVAWHLGWVLLAQLSALQQQNCFVLLSDWALSKVFVPCHGYNVVKVFRSEVQTPECSYSLLLQNIWRSSRRWLRSTTLSSATTWTRLDSYLM